MKIILTGGGSGGHITPLLAIAHEVKKQNPKVDILYIGQKNDGLGDIPGQDKNIDQVFTVRAGKFRRYHGEGLKQFLDLHTAYLNARDMIFAFMGLFQSVMLLFRLRPDIVFIKGGYVGVPVGLASALLRIPYITHDSDALPGLANRIIAKWALMHTVALPKEIYKTYPPEKVVTVGVPIAHEYNQSHDQAYYKKEIGLDAKSKVLLITGGGLGASRINEAVQNIMGRLLDGNRDLYVFHIAGRKNQDSVKKYYDQNLNEEHKKRVVVFGYITDLYKYSGAADLVVARAGATNIAEFSAQGKACIIIPNPYLTGGHQIVNAKILNDKHAISVVNENQLELTNDTLYDNIVELLDNKQQRKILEENIKQLAYPDAAVRLADILLNQTSNK